MILDSDSAWVADGLYLGYLWNNPTEQLGQNGRCSIYTYSTDKIIQWNADRKAFSMKSVTNISKLLTVFS